MNIPKINMALRISSILKICVCVALLLPFPAHGQAVGISNNAATPNPAAMLDITSGSGSNLGILIPRVTFAERTGNFNPMPVACQGLTVYQTDAGGLGEGLYYNISTTTTASWVKTGASGWDIAGNNGTSPGPNMVGTTDGTGMDFRTNNNICMSISAAGNVGFGGAAPGVPFAVGGNGGNVYATDGWIENNIHVQGNEGVAGGRGRLRIGTYSGKVGLYAELNSIGAANDLVLGASSGIVRIGAGQKLILPASTGFLKVDNAAVDRLLVTDASGNGSWQDLGAVLQVYYNAASQTTINSTSYIDITGLSRTITLSNTSYVIVHTTGTLEYPGTGGQAIGTITTLMNNGVALQEQGTDFSNDGFVPLPQLDKIWDITQGMTLAPGTYTFSVKSRYYIVIGFGAPAFFYAGGCTSLGSSSNGSMVIKVISQ